MKKLTFITGNKIKAEQLARHLNHPVDHIKIDLLEIQSLDLDEIIEHKAKEAYKIIKSPLIVDDVSLQFNALGRLPGPLIRWFIDEINPKGLCKLLDSYQDRSAVGKISLGFFDGQILKIFSADIHGIISDAPKGNNGFGWDPIFIPVGHNKTWAEMDEEERNKTYIRPIALKKLEEYLINKY